MCDKLYKKEFLFNYNEAWYNGLGLYYTAYMFLSWVLVIQSNLKKNVLNNW